MTPRALRIFSLSLAIALAIGRGVSAQSTEERLDALVDDYFDSFLELNPVFATSIGDHRFDDRLTIDISLDHRRRSLELEERALQQARALDTADLGPDDRLTLRIFIAGRDQEIRSNRFPSHLLPVDHLQSLPVLLPLLGGGDSFQPFESVEDYDRWLVRARSWPLWVDQAVENMRLGIERGIVQPWPIVERLIPILESQVVIDPRASTFFDPVRRMPGTFTKADRSRLDAAFVELIGETIVPGYRRLLDFVRTVYLPQARVTVGLGDLDGGREWYDFLIRKHASTDLSAPEIHALGKREVTRLESRIKRLEKHSGALRPDQEAARRSLLDGYRALLQAVEPRLPDLFSSIPKAPVEIQPVEPFRRRSAPGASYMPAPADASRPGRFYVNAGETDPGVPSESLFLHEAVPGHHFQMSLQRERIDVPRFRRFLHVTAFTEGWALYAESLGEPLGLYRSSEQQLRALRSELFRARRLVVDTGIHALGWSRDRAIEYLGSAREVDRYIAWPGQALSYKIGELEIVGLRQDAEKRLGRRFDLRAFHEVVLEGGAMPLQLLRQRVDAWVERTLESTTH